NAEVFGEAQICTNTIVCSDIKISNTNDILFINLARYITFYRCEDAIRCTIGCQYAITIEEFKERVYENGNYTEVTLPKHRKDYLLAIEFAKKYFRVD
ncbi:hypothetical protein ACLWWF_001223, partial [Campylobacter jejuni]